MIKQSADSSPQAQPTVDEIQEQIGADDEAGRAADDEAVRQDMFTKKNQENK